MYGKNVWKVNLPGSILGSFYGVLNPEEEEIVDDEASASKLLELIIGQSNNGLLIIKLPAIYLIQEETFENKLWSFLDKVCNGDCDKELARAEVQKYIDLIHIRTTLGTIRDVTDKRRREYKNDVLVRLNRINR